MGDLEQLLLKVPASDFSLIIYSNLDFCQSCHYDVNAWCASKRRSFYGRAVQSTLVISNSKGLSEILRDIRTSTYQICRIEEKLIRTTTFNKFICNWTLEVRDIAKILWKRGEIFHLLLDFHI